MKKSKWFDGAKFVPAHVGVYETYYVSFVTTYQYWNGKFWGMCNSTPDRAAHYNDHEIFGQNRKWRGIKK